MPSSPSIRRMRWLTPAGVLAIILVAGFLQAFSATAVPDLAPLTPQQLIAKVQQTKVQTFSGTIQLDTNLGIPNLSALQGAAGAAGAGGFNPTDFLSGTHRADIAADGPDKQRLSMAGPLSEIDVFHNGNDVWTWQSAGSLVSHTVLHHGTAGKPDATKPEATPDATKPADATEAASPMLTPDQLAQKFLDKITPSTAVSVTTPAQIAGHDAYELVLAPHDAKSTIDHVTMAIDATNGFPLRVAVWAKGATKPAIQLGFIKLSYAKPSGSFSFTPPPGSHTASSPIATAKAAGPEQMHRFHGMKGATPAQIAAMKAQFAARQAARQKQMAAFQPAAGAAANGHPTVVGQDWLQVVIADHAAIPRDQSFELMKATTPVSGAFGSGRLLHTDLISVLFLNDGRVAAGFVTPAALEAAVPHA